LDGRDSRIILDLHRVPTMRHLLYILYQPYKWLVVIPLLLLSTLLLGTAAIVIATTVSPKLASATCGVWWSRLNSFMTPMLVSVRGRRHIDKEQSYVIISNHLSHYDIFVLYGWLGIDFKWVMKKELRNLPALGAACEKIGHIYIDRSNRETAIASLVAAKKKIVNGTSVLFFPEGTRSTSGEMGEFKKGAFFMALDLGIPILPITVLHTDKILPSRTMDLFPGRASMVVHEPIDVSGYGTERLGELMSTVREVIRAGLESE
jgi:1-acyl-sn-glycerol-3-phosphate acyltransferase